MRRISLFPQPSPLHLSEPWDRKCDVSHVSRTVPGKRATIDSKCRRHSAFLPSFPNSSNYPISPTLPKLLLLPYFLHPFAPLYNYPPLRLNLFSRLNPSLPS